MFRYSVAFIIFVFTVLGKPPDGEAKYASIVVDAKTGRVLYSVNSNTKNYPASLTKIMTLFITFDAIKSGSLRLGQRLPVSRIAESRSPSRLGLRRGESISVENAIRALATKSANDIATVLAESIGGTERKFARIMTRRARALGMKNTTFRNASGLPNRGQLSSAKDMAILARALLNQHPDMYHYFSKKTCAFDCFFNKIDHSYFFSQTNRHFYNCSTKMSPSRAALRAGSQHTCRPEQFFLS